jgi:hypothetical protein
MVELFTVRRSGFAPLRRQGTKRKAEYVQIGVLGLLLLKARCLGEFGGERDFPPPILVQPPSRNQDLADERNARRTMYLEQGALESANMG